jgi:hypothetical protein
MNKKVYKAHLRVVAIERKNELRMYLAFHTSLTLYPLGAMAGIIRFELPMDAWCQGCKRHYGKGTRWNAKKEEDGAYFRTKIWKFTMTCHSCPAVIVIATDPKNTTYDFREGLKQKDEEGTVDPLESTAAAGQQESLDALYKTGGHAGAAEREAKRTNEMYKLEHAQDDYRRAATEEERMGVLLEVGSTQRQYDYDANAALRQAMRGRRAQAAALVAEQASLQLAVPLLAESEDDRLNARQLAQQQPHLMLQERRRSRGIVNDANKDAKRQRLALATSSAFGASSVLHQRGLQANALFSAVPALANAARAAHEQGYRDERCTSHASAHSTLPVIKKRARKLPLNDTKKGMETVTAAGVPPSDPSICTPSETVEVASTRQVGDAELNALSSLSGLYDSDSGNE